MPKPEHTGTPPGIGGPDHCGLCGAIYPQVPTATLDAYHTGVQRLTAEHEREQYELLLSQYSRFAGLARNLDLPDKVGYWQRRVADLTDEWTRKHRPAPARATSGASVGGTTAV